ncbi:MAG: ubiquinone/menaquinone biosynthesis methyltransferase [Deltaproteobacteria bacterium]|nr:ubiquinone/menaquinone biosynthesis methyltransferase [Deltaproteobacteria bacterium]
MPDLQQLFTNIAPTYDKLNRWLSFSRDRRWRTHAIGAITPRLSFRVLDLCAGTLDMSVAMLRRFPQATITCVDFSAKMLELGMRKVPHVFQRQVETRCEDAMRFAFPDHSFDVVLCAFGMRNLPDQVRALQQIRRVLEPNGELVILEFFQPTTTAARWFGRTYGRYIIPLLGGLLSKQRPAYEYLRDSTAAFYPLSAYRALLRQHGFHVRVAEELSGGVASLIVAEPNG